MDGFYIDLWMCFTLNSPRVAPYTTIMEDYGQFIDPNEGPDFMYPLRCTWYLPPSI